VRKAAGWNAAAYLRCISCGAARPVGPEYSGCPSCPANSPLEVAYEGPVPSPDGISVLKTLRTALQPIESSHIVDLGQTLTPLVRLPSVGPNVWMKNESISPTWSHKDRYNSIAISAARLLGALGVVTTSTGNHGASAAAHAAAAGLRSVVFCHPAAPPSMVRMMRAFGAVPAKLEAAAQRRWLELLVDGGWYPATSMDPQLAGRGNPYGVEGYKPVAYEIVEQLGGIPDAVFIPAASGDTLYGIGKGFQEVTERTGLGPAKIFAGQPEVANPLVRSLEAGRPVSVEEAETLALSVGDARTGRHAFYALRHWRGAGVSVSEDGIVSAVRKLASLGFYAEPASAVSLAAYWKALDTGVIEKDASAVLVLTSSGAKWPEAMAEIFSEDPEGSEAEVKDMLASEPGARTAPSLAT
jgi:threonine synthase